MCGSSLPSLKGMTREAEKEVKVVVDRDRFSTVLASQVEGTLAVIVIGQVNTL